MRNSFIEKNYLSSKLKENSEGGGIFISQAQNFTLYNTKVKLNYAYQYGGGVFLHNIDSIRVNKSTFLEN